MRYLADVISLIILLSAESQGYKTLRDGQTFRKAGRYHARSTLDGVYW